MEANQNCITNKYINLNLYIFNGTEDLYITIKGVEDSVYLMYNFNNNNMFDSFLQITSNYLFRFEDISYDKLSYDIYLNMLQKYQNRKYYNKLFPFYLSIYPINCKFDIEILFDTVGVFQPENSSFIQYIGKDNVYYELIKDEKEENSSCLLYSSVYQLDNQTGILMAKDFSQSFYLNLQYNNITVSYYHIEKNNNVTINIDFNGTTESKYDLIVYLNEDFYKKLSIGFNEKFALTSEIIKNQCKNYLFLCKITLYIEFQKDLQLNETILNIIFTEENNTKNDNDKDNDNNSHQKKEDSDSENDKEKSESNKHLEIIIPCVVIGFVIIIIIIIFTIFLLNKYKKKKQLKELINNISFMDDRDTYKKENENEDGLLY